MHRRDFLKAAGITGAASLLPAAPLSVWGLPANNFTGDFLFNIQILGGWDVTSFCDPKINIAGEKLINTWAQTQPIQTSGNLRFAPIGDNGKLFQQHGAKMLVINGVNIGTTSHTGGAYFTHTGSRRAGMPHLSALYAFEKGRGMAMPLLISNKIATASLVAPTTFSRNTEQLINPNIWRPESQTTTYLPPEDLHSVHALRLHLAQKLKLGQYSLPKQQQQIDEYHAAVTADTAGFNEFKNVFNNVNLGEFTKTAGTDATQFALTGFKLGLGIAADITLAGWDTHGNHDAAIPALFNNLYNTLGALWYFAEQLGIADRLVVNIASDFGRTPFYNSGMGKDHWIYGSQVIMKSQVNWTNRTVGASDDGHVAVKINPTTLQSDNTGMVITPAHIHLGLRDLLGIASSPSAAQFDLKVDKRPDFFNPNIHTSQSLGTS